MDRVCTVSCFLVSVLSSCFLQWSCSPSARATTAATVAAIETVPVHVAQAIVMDVPYVISTVGNVEPLRSIDVRSHVAGEIAELAFQEGQIVNKGQVLFRLDASTWQRQAAERRADIVRDTAAKEQAEAQLDRDRAAQQQSRLEANDAAKLFKEGILANERTQQLLTADRTAEAAVRADEAAIQVAAGSLEADRARLSQTELQMQFSTIVAPLSGRVGAASTKPGSLIRDNDTVLVTVRQVSPVGVSFAIPEQALGEVRRLQATQALTVQALLESKVLQGRLQFIDAAADSATGTVRMRSEFANPGEELWPGEFVQVRLQLRVDPQRIVVPESAVKQGQQGPYIWRVRSRVAAIVPVDVGRTYKPQTGPPLAVLRSGVQPGDMVVTEGQMRLTAGAHISVLGTED